MLSYLNRKQAIFGYYNEVRTCKQFECFLCNCLILLFKMLVFKSNNEMIKQVATYEFASVRDNCENWRKWTDVTYPLGAAGNSRSGIALGVVVCVAVGKLWILPEWSWWPLPLGLGGFMVRRKK
jgi:hypothetical protein